MWTSVDWMIVAICALSYGLYHSCLDCSFVWDDLRALQTNEDVIGVLRPNGTLWEAKLLEHDFWGDPIASEMSHKSYRPITVWSYRLDVYLCAVWMGSNDFARSFHLTNVVLHCVCTFLTGLLAKVLFGKHFNKEKADSMEMVFVGLATLLFAVHSVHVEAVAGLVGRADVLSCMFFLCAILVYERFQSLLGALVFAILATGCKESGITVLGYCVLVEILTTGKPANQRVWRISCILLAVYALMVARMSLHQGYDLYPWTIMENHISLEPNLVKRYLTYAHTHGRYALLLLIPYPLAFDHGYATISILEYPSLLSIVAYLSLSCLVFWGLKKFDVLILKSVGIGLLPFVPASNLLFPVGTILAERLLYTSSVGYCLLMGLACCRVRFRNTFVVVFVLYCMGLAWQTSMRNLDWFDDKALYESGVRSEPESLTALNNAAHLYLQSSNRTELELAKQRLLKALSLHPVFKSAWHNLGIVYRRMNQHKEAIESFQQALDVAEDCNVRALLGDELIRNGQPEVARGHLVQATGECNIPYASLSLIELDRAIHGPSQAILDRLETLLVMNEQEDVRHSNHIDPADLLNEMGIIANELGNVVEGAKYFERSIDVFHTKGEPARIHSLCNAAVMGWIELHRKFGDQATYRPGDDSNVEMKPLERAEQLLKLALDQAPNNALIITNYGWLLEYQGRLLEARAYYNKAISILPDHAKIRENVERVNNLLRNSETKS